MYLNRNHILKLLSPYHFSSNALVMLVLASLLWANVVSYYDLNYAESELLEICDPIDGESEKEEKNIEEDSDEKIPLQSSFHKFDPTDYLINNFCSEDFYPVYHPERLTPPPESFLFLS